MKWADGESFRRGQASIQVSPSRPLMARDLTVRGRRWEGKHAAHDIDLQRVEVELCHGLWPGSRGVASRGES